MVDMANWDEVEAWIDEHAARGREYTVLVVNADASTETFPLVAVNEQAAYRVLDSMYMALNNGEQVYGRQLLDAVRVELLDYLTDATLASYSVVR